jgi:AcrR family transcriptional regulator
MPRAFTTDEATAIRAELMAAGAESFARMGIRRTTVDELARAAGISKGAFYNFFDTKESLFLALLEDHEIRAHAEVEAAVRADPHRGLDTLIDTAMRATLSNPLLSVAMSQEGLRLLHGMTEAQREAFAQRDVRLVERILELLRQAGVHVGVPSTVLVALLRSLVFVGWHRGEIGEGLTEELAAWLTPTLRAALLSGSSSTEAAR